MVSEKGAGNEQSREVGDYDVEFEVRERPGRMDPVEGGDDEATA